MSGPLCRCCGKSIPKRTDTHYFRHDADPPMTRAEAQRRVNQQIISVNYSRYDGMRYVHRVGVWDGATFAPVYGYFCTLACAADFGRLAVTATNLRTVKYSEAVALHRGES